MSEFEECEISGAYFSQKHFKETWTPKQLAIIFCKLNRWETPEEFNLGRKMTDYEIRKVFAVLRNVVPKKEWLAEWNNPSPESVSGE